MVVASQVHGVTTEVGPIVTGCETIPVLPGRGGVPIVRLHRQTGPAESGEPWVDINAQHAVVGCVQRLAAYGGGVRASSRCSVEVDVARAGPGGLFSSSIHAVLAPPDATPLRSLRRKGTPIAVYTGPFAGASTATNNTTTPVRRGPHSAHFHELPRTGSDSNDVA